MDDILEIILEFLEIILEFYLKLMLMVVPTENVTKKRKVLAGIIAVVMALGLPVLFFVGFWLSLDGDKPWGMMLMIFSGVLIVAQIIAGVLLYEKNHNS